MQVSHCLSLAFPLLSSRRHCLSLAFPLLSSLRRCLSVAATQEIYQKCQPAIRPKDDDAAWAAADTFRCVLRCAEPLRCVWWLLCRVCCVLFWYMPCALLCVYLGGNPLAAVPWWQQLPSEPMFGFRFVAQQTKKPLRVGNTAHRESMIIGKSSTRHRAPRLRFVRGC